MNVLSRLANALIERSMQATRWLVLAVALLLLVQWPLREIFQRYSREANDLGQLLFALYVAVALCAATRRRSHLASDAIARHYGPRLRRALSRTAASIALVPWAGFVLVSSAPTIWRSLAVAESFPETYNPGYFIVKLSVWILASLLMVQGLLHAFDRDEGRDKR